MTERLLTATEKTLRAQLDKIEQAAKRAHPEEYGDAICGAVEQVRELLDQSEGSEYRRGFAWFVTVHLLLAGAPKEGDERWVIARLFEGKPEVLDWTASDGGRSVHIPIPYQSEAVNLRDLVRDSTPKKPEREPGTPDGKTSGAKDREQEADPDVAHARRTIQDALMILQVVAAHGQDGHMWQNWPGIRDRAAAAIVALNRVRFVKAD